jgi:hypothetical protein
MPLLTVDAAGLHVELAELGTVLGVVGFNRLPSEPSSMGTVCLEELLHVSLGSAVTVGDDLTGGGTSVQLPPVSALVCEEAATAVLFLHM